MTVLRRTAIEVACGSALQSRVQRGARAALALRGLIAVFTLALVIVGAGLAN